jgi:hypothetical protein
MLLPCITRGFPTSLHSYAPWVCNDGVTPPSHETAAIWRLCFVQSVVLDVMMDNERWDTWADKFLQK